MANQMENYKVLNSYHLNNQTKITNTSPNNKSLIYYGSQIRDSSQGGFSDYYMPGSSRQAAISSIYKGIKNNDVSQILGKSVNRSFLPSISNRNNEEVKTLKQKKDNLNENFDEKYEVHKGLTEMRKNFDQTRTLANRKEIELKQLQEESDKLKEKEQFLKENNIDVIQNEKEMVQDSEEAKIGVEERSQQRKSYLFMKERLQNDIYHSHELKMIKQEKQKINVSSYQAKQFNDQTSKMMDEVMIKKYGIFDQQNIEVDRRERESKLNTMKTQIQARQEIDRKREERMIKMMIIADHAMHDKDPQEKKWRQLLLVHKFVRNVLKQKMEREMKKFGVVESSFQKIKTDTGVSESDEIVSKFLSREQTYGDLLATIAESETQIDNLKKRNDQQNQKLQDLKQELVSLETQQKKGKPSFKEQENNQIISSFSNIKLLKKLDSMNDRVQRADLLKQKLYQWCIRLLIKHEQVNRPKGISNFKRTNYYEKFGRDQIDELFEKICFIFHGELDQVKDDEIEHILDQLNQTNVNDETQNEEFIRRNLRIKPTVKQQKSNNQPSDDPSFNSEKDSRDSSANKSQSFIESETETTEVDEDAEVNHIMNLRGELKRERELQIKKKRLEKEKEKEKEKVQQKNNQK